MPADAPALTTQPGPGDQPGDRGVLGDDHDTERLVVDDATEVPSDDPEVEVAGDDVDAPGVADDEDVPTDVESDDADDEQGDA